MSGLETDGFLGEILVRKGRLRPEDLQTALEEQRREGGQLGDILQRNRLCGEEDLLQAQAEQLGLAFAPELRPEQVDIELLGKVPIGFAKQQRMIPLQAEGEQVAVALADPLAVFAIDDMRQLLGCDVRPVLASGNKIIDLINKLYARRTTGVDLEENDEEGLGGQAEELVDLLDTSDEAPIIRWVNSLMFQAVKERASDIHIEPGEKEVVVRYRIDGVLYETKRANRGYLPSIISRVKIMAGLNIAEKRLPQDGRIRRKIAGKDIDMRVATIPTAGGERVTIRLLDRTAVLLDLRDIGFGPDHLATIDELIHRPHGILLVTGPTGSGKTTTLYACLSKINSRDLNILTIEDPVEYQLDGVSQTQVNPKIELTFATGLRSFLRHDPDVIMVGEIRDLDTAEIAIQASLTGHLVFSTIHTNDAAGGITRLVDMGVEPFLVASSLIGILAQRLVRRVCQSCREVHRPTELELRSLGLDPALFFSPGGILGSGQAIARAVSVLAQTARTTPPPAGHIYRPKGCARCLDTGYSGRTGIYELMLPDDDIRTLALKKTESNQMKRLAVQKGMRTLRDDGALKVLAGMTTLEEVMRVTQEDVA